MSKLVGKWIILQAYKHNEELHRQWSHSYVLTDNEDYYAVASIRASVIESDGRKWHTKEPAIFILPKNKWFNVIAMLKEDNTITYYTNLASPTIFDKGFLKYIDYDLDIKMYGDGSTRLLDVSEYRKHATELGYSEDIMKILEDTVKDIYSLMKQKEFPFNDDAIRKFFDEFYEKANAQ